MRVCLMIEGQENVTWHQWLALATAAEAGGFDGLFTSDHYFSVEGAAGRGSFDAWTVLSALASRTRRIRLGTLVSPATFRLPAVLAKAATTVDHVSGGRMELGMGAGWWEEEHRTHGVPFPPTAERIDRLAEQLEIVHGLWTEGVFSFKGQFYAVEDCPFQPKPVQQPHPPIIVGGKGGPRIASLAAAWADEFNTYHAMPDACRDRFARVHDAAERSGRAAGSLRTSLMAGCVIGATESEFRARVERLMTWDAEDSRGLTADQYVDRLDAMGSVIGTPAQAVERLGEFEEAGVQRIFLQHWLHDEVEMTELLAAQVLPQVSS